LFIRDASADPLIAGAIAVDPETLHPIWSRTIENTLSRATLTRPADGWMQSGGRAGRHSEHLGHLLSELQFLARSHPGATW